MTPRGLERHDLVRAAEIIASADIAASDEETARRLIEVGFDEPTAYRLVAFLPEAFARPLLAHFGVTDFSPVTSVAEDGGNWFEVRLVDQPEYVAALALAEEHFRVGAIDNDLYQRVVTATSQVGALNKALNEGADVAGSAAAFALASSCHARFVFRPQPQNLIQRLARALGPSR